SGSGVDAYGSAYSESVKSLAVTNGIDLYADASLGSGSIQSHEQVFAEGTVVLDFTIPVGVYFVTGGVTGNGFGVQSSGNGTQRGVANDQVYFGGFNY